MKKVIALPIDMPYDTNAAAAERAIETLLQFGAIATDATKSGKQMADVAAAVVAGWTPSEAIAHCADLTILGKQVEILVNAIMATLAFQITQRGMQRADLPTIESVEAFIAEDKKRRGMA